MSTLKFGGLQSDEEKRAVLQSTLAGAAARGHQEAFDEFLKLYEGECGSQPSEVGDIFKLALKYSQSDFIRASLRPLAAQLSPDEGYALIDEATRANKKDCLEAMMDVGLKAKLL